VFVRIRTALDTTGTFKHRKDQLIREGYDPGATNDAIYFGDPEQESYVPIDAQVFERIQAGAVRT
jgi:fatty-acyl-CoA synthase